MSETPTSSSMEGPIYFAILGGVAFLLLLALVIFFRRKFAKGPKLLPAIAEEKKAGLEEGESGAADGTGPDAAAGDLEAGAEPAKKKPDGVSGAVVAEDKSVFRKLFGCLRTPQVLPDAQGDAAPRERPDRPEHTSDIEKVCSPEVQKLLRRLVEVIGGAGASDAALSQRVEELEKQVLSLHKRSAWSPEGKLQQEDSPATPEVRPLAKPLPPPCDPPLLPPVPPSGNGPWKEGPPSTGPLPPVQQLPKDTSNGAGAALPPPLSQAETQTQKVTVNQAEIQTDPEPLNATNRSVFGSTEGSVFQDLERTQKLEFGPTDRQLGLPEGAEIHTVKGGGIGESVTLRASNESLLIQLKSRDSQTQELHKQLKEARIQLLEHAAASRAAEARLRAAVTTEAEEGAGKNTVTEAGQKEVVLQQQKKIEDLSKKLHELTYQCMHWQTVAKRQRAFFLHSERVAESDSPSEFLKCLKNHPAGEVFVPPPPCVQPDEDTGPAWDIGSSGANPYVVDSWPIEPNSQAQRPAAQHAPPMGSWDENSEEEEEESDEDSTDGKIGEGNSHRRDSGPSGWNFTEEESRHPGGAQRRPPGNGTEPEGGGETGSGSGSGFRDGLRLPQLPLLHINGGAGSSEAEDDEGESSPPRAGNGPGGLPMPRFESSDTARSL